MKLRQGRWQTLVAVACVTLIFCALTLSSAAAQGGTVAPPFPILPPMTWG